jgi:hypothetical protein
MYKFKKYLLTAAGFVILLSALVLQLDAPMPQAQGSETTNPIGLSLFFQNGAMAPLTLVGDAPRFLQEIDVTATVTTPTDEGINPLLHTSEFSSLDWTGVTQVEEDWRPAGDGTFTRQHFYRGAAWMEQASKFLVFPTDSTGTQVGDPLIANAGKDDRLGSADDGFVRRFVARQIATGCRSVGDCTGATFTAQGLVQLRDALQADERARPIPAEATRLTLKWTVQDQTPRTVEIAHASPADFPFGYGFRISLDETSTPANGSFYVPGEPVSFRVTFRDGQGKRLHPPGSLPTFGQFLRGEIATGLRYYDGFRLFPTTYYALKHRESNLLVTLSGPTDTLRTPRTIVDAGQFFVPAPAIAVTTVGTDGFSDLAAGVPPFYITFGGLFDPTLWETPVSDSVNFTIPSEALPGTYVAAVKARREFGGEALNRATTSTIQVGTATPTTFTAQTGNCTSCHTGPSALGSILHGVTDRRACYSCHASLNVEPDTALDTRVHEVHDRSGRFPADIHNCATCHLTPPGGPARGLLGN